MKINVRLNSEIENKSKISILGLIRFAVINVQKNFFNNPDTFLLYINRIYVLYVQINR